MVHLMVKKRGLGKSLDALLAYTGSDATNTTTDAPIASDTLCRLPLEQIHRGKYQPRRDINPEALEDLTNSIRSQGIIQPIIVRPLGVNNQYEIIAGERRWRASQLAGLTDIPAIVRDIPDATAMAIGLIENIQRENLNPIEEAAALQRLLGEFGMTHQEVAEAIGKSRATVTNLLRLLTLPEAIKSLLEQGVIEMGHARAIVALPEALQLQAIEIITTRRLSVRDTEQLVRRLQNETNTTPSNARKPLDPDIQKLQESLSKQLRMRVAIQCNAKGKGKLVIHYRNLRELDELMAQLREDMIA
jgi:ParB family chromosome partitioning protein